MSFRPRSGHLLVALLLAGSLSSEIGTVVEAFSTRSFFSITPTVATDSHSSRRTRTTSSTTTTILWDTIARTVDFSSSAAKMAGAGNATVDMNQYNLPIEEIYQEWTANLVAKTANTEEGVVLGCRSSRELMVDTVQVSFPRNNNQGGAGLGIQLEEIASRPEDGLGITLVTSLVEGGLAQGTDILPGDSITKVSLLRRTRRNDYTSSSLDVQEELFEAPSTECLNFESTMAAIASLPPPPAPSSKATRITEDLYIVTLKRLRRKPKVTIQLQYPPEQGEDDVTLELFAGEILRQAMLTRGVKLNDPYAQRFDTKNDGNCGANGLCRTCAVSIMKGEELLNPKKLSEAQMLADTPRWRLACKAVVGWGMKEGEITLRVNPRQW